MSVYNEKFIEILGELASLMQAKGEQFRAKAYTNGQQAIIMYNGDIHGIEDIKNVNGIGKTILEKLNEYVTTGKVQLLEEERNSPYNQFMNIYGVGPKKAAELSKMGLKSVEELKEYQEGLGNKSVLNDVQQVGLRYYFELLERIPRVEIDEYNKIIGKEIAVINAMKLSSSALRYEIVGSYRRGALTSGDIDIILTGGIKEMYEILVDNLLENGIIEQILSRGAMKTLVIGRLKGGIARRLDFLYTSETEFPFALLYFTGSKVFNTVMRQHALNMGYTLNEHELRIMQDGSKGDLVTKKFYTEADIFNYLNMKYKEPMERIGADSVEIVPELMMVNRFKTEGKEYLGTLTELDLSKMIQYANNAYYNVGQPIMTDTLFDVLFEYVRERYPRNELVQQTGAEIDEDEMIVISQYPMPSMCKIKADDGELSKYLREYRDKKIISPKLDGMSILYEVGPTVSLLTTKGRDDKRQDVSELILDMGLPTWPEVLDRISRMDSNLAKKLMSQYIVKGKGKGIDKIVVRGELIMPKREFAEKYANSFATVRNMIAGKLKKRQKGILDWTHFIVYELVDPNVMKLSEQLQVIRALGFKTVDYWIHEPIITNKMLSDKLLDMRENYEYDIDGLIVANDGGPYARTEKCPDHAFAFKMVMDDQSAEVIVTDVLWTASKDGYLKPRIRYEPVIIGGTRYEYATGSNAGFIRDNRIGIGALIEIVRSGDVIPKVTKVIIPAEEGKLPLESYEWTKGGVDAILTNKEGNEDVKVGIIVRFFKGIGVKGLDTGNATKLVDGGYDTIEKICGMKVSDYLTLVGFGKKSAEKLYDSVQTGLKSATLSHLMYSSNVFGRGFGEKKVALILDEYPNVLTDEVSYAEKVNRIAGINGMSIASATTFVNGINEFIHFLTNCGLTVHLEKKMGIKEKSDMEIYWKGKTVILTGQRDAAIMEYLTANKVNVGSKVSSKTSMVVSDDVNSDSVKAEDARRLGVPIISNEDFKATYKI